MSATELSETPATQLREPHEQSGAHERHLAAGSIAQQVTLLISAVTALLVITVLARTLSLSRFGLYGILVSIPTYLQFAQGSIETAAVKTIAQGRDQLARDRALTTALCAYTGFGVLAALAIVFGGGALLGVLHIRPSLHADAHQGLLALAAVNVVGWPVKAAQDALRGNERFVASAAAEAAGYVTFGALLGLALLLAAPLWVLVGLGGAIPLFVGLWSAAAVVVVRLPVGVRFSTLSTGYTRSFLSVSFYLLISGVADFVIYSLDRTILGANRSVATVGLYEGPLRAHNLLRQLQGALALTVMPAAAAYVAAGDSGRLRELLVRGTRYIALAMMPLTVTFMILPRAILEVWLGPRFGGAGGAMTILVAYWLLAGGSTVGLTMMIAVGRVKTIVVYACAVAALNLALSLTLTPLLGLDGVVIGTSVPYVLILPVFITITCRQFAVPIGEFLRAGFAVASAAGAALAAVELLARATLPVERGTVLIPTVAIALAGYALGVYRLGLNQRERLLVGTTLATARRRVVASTGRLTARD
jgi:O-antigen/teichoic acid export membrane protein